MSDERFYNVIGNCGHKQTVNTKSDNVQSPQSRWWEGDQHGSTWVNMGGGCRAARGLQYIDYLPDQWPILLHSKPPTARILSLTHPLTYYMYLTIGTHITALP